MVAKDNPHVEQFEKTLLKWDDERFVSREQIRDMAMFILYLVNLSEGDGWVYNGHSLRVKETTSILTVKGTIDGIPHVVFSSGRDTMGCIRAFLRKLDEGWLEWVVDKYR